MSRRAALGAPLLLEAVISHCRPPGGGSVWLHAAPDEGGLGETLARWVPTAIFFRLAGMYERHHQPVSEKQWQQATPLGVGTVTPAA